MSPTCGKIFIVDDDPAVGKALTRLFDAAGYQAEVFASAHDFLKARRHVDGPCCMVLDVKMPGLGGLELQEELIKEACALPIVFMTGYGDIPSSVRAMKHGAVTFLSKPVDDNVLIQAVQEGLTRDALRKQGMAELEFIQNRVASLTDREHEILIYVISGLLNKQIASSLEISEKTVKVHRGRVMNKMKAASFAELVRMAGKAGIQPALEPEV